MHAGPFSGLTLFSLVSLCLAALPMPGNLENNVKTTFGAAGNGTTDDTQALRSALAQNRTNTSVDYYYPAPRAFTCPPV